MRSSRITRFAIVIMAILASIFATDLKPSISGFIDVGETPVTARAGHIYTYMSSLPSTWPENLFPYVSVAGQSRTTQGSIVNSGSLDANLRIEVDKSRLSNTVLLDQSDVELKFDSVSVYKGKFSNLQVSNKLLRANQTIAIEFTLTIPATQQVSDNQWEYQYPNIKFISTPVVSVPGYEVLSSVMVTLKPETWRVKASDITTDPGYFPDGKCLNIQWHAPEQKIKKYTLQISTSPTMSNPIQGTFTETAEYAGYMMYRFLNVSPNTTYYYRIRADDAYRVEWSSIGSTKTGAGLAPDALFSCV